MLYTDCIRQCSGPLYTVPASSPAPVLPPALFPLEGMVVKLRAQGVGNQLTWAFTLLCLCFFFSQSLCLCFPLGPHGAAGHGQHYQLVTVSLATVCGNLAGWTAGN